MLPGLYASGYMYVSIGDSVGYSTANNSAYVYNAINKQMDTTSNGCILGYLTAAEPHTIDLAVTNNPEKLVGGIKYSIGSTHYPAEQTFFGSSTAGATGDLNKIKLLSIAGNIVSGKISIYGVKQ